MEPQVKQILDKASPYLSTIVDVANRYNLSVPHLVAQIKNESSFNPKAVSPKGAVGIAQFMPATAQMYGLKDRTDPVASLEAMGKHMRDLLDANNNDQSLALAAYNAGQPKVNKYGGVPPFKETQDYIKKISALSEILAPMLNQQTTPQNVPQTAQQEQVVQQAVEPSFQPKKTSLIDTINSIMAALGGVGGNVANIIGGIKGTGSPGDQALKMSASLLDHISKQQQEARKRQELSDFFNASTSDPKMKQAALFLAKSGDLKGATELLVQPYKDQQSSKKAIQIEKDKLLDPELQRLRTESENQKMNTRLKEDAAKFDYKKNSPQEQAKFKLDLMNKFRQEPIIKSTRELNTRSNIAESMYDQFQAGKGSLNTLDQALITTFNKVQEPDSVVMVSEFNRLPEGVALMERIPGWIEKLKNGGAGIGMKERAAMINDIKLMRTISNQSAQPLIDNYSGIAQELGFDPNALFYSGSPQSKNSTPQKTQSTNAPKGVNLDELAKSLGGVIRKK